MATLNSNEVTRVYGSETTITSSTARTGDYAFAANGGLQVATFSYTSTAAGSGGNVHNLTVLPLNAVVVGAALQCDAGYGGSASSTLTFKIDTVDIGTAIGIGTSGTSGYQAGNGTKVLLGAAGLVTLTESGHAISGDKAVSGQIFYYVAD